MRMSRLFKQSIISLGRNRLRSSLVIVGVLVGIVALTVVVGMTKAANRKVMQRVNNFGPTAIMLFAGGGKNLPGPDPTVATLTFDDAKAVETQIRGVQFICPQVMRPRVPASYRDRATEVTIQGAATNWQEAWDWYVSDGDFYDDRDFSSMARVAVIGKTVVRELFQGANPVGETIRIKDANFEVKGVLPAKGTAPNGSDMDDRIIIPLTTAMRRTFNVSTLTMVRVRVAGVGDVQRVASEIRSLVRERHHVRPPDVDDFRVITPDIISGLSEMVAGTLNRVLLAVTVVSLIVGGIVLMNLMLLSVAERRHEIGLRRAVGGRRRDVLLQFLFESLGLTVAGGALGLLVGMIVSLVLVKLKPGSTQLSWEPVALGLGLSLLVGVVFGLLPARRAARLHPVEALR
jgi:putative ABC transport system permease protein